MSVDDRLRRLLGGDALAGLRRRLRQRYVNGEASGNAVGVLRLGSLNETEQAALAALAGCPARGQRSLRIDVAEVDAALQRAGLATSLRAALEQLDGAIVDGVAQALRLRSQWQQVAAAGEHEGLRAALQTAGGRGLLKRLSANGPELAERLVGDADAVLRRLPAAGIPRARLAVEALGDAHALDDGRPVATLVLSALRQGAEPGEIGGERRRDLWAAAGVLVNELAKPVLVLNLPGLADVERGEPAYLSLRRLLRSPPRWQVAAREVFVCENPNLLAIAADQLASRCAPLVCTDGMPAAAQRTLLEQLSAAGASLRYHGDFDWPGVQIGNHLIRAHGARPWRFAAADYRQAALAAPRSGRRLDTAAVQASWDAGLAAVMLAAGLAIEEEAVASSLLDDLCG